MAEAYFVAPLAAAQVVDENVISAQYFEETARAAPSSTPVDVKFRDIWAAVIFLAQVFVIVWLATRSVMSYFSLSSSSDVDTKGLGIIATACVCLGAIATVLGCLGLTVLLKYSESIIEGVMWFNIASLVLSGVLAMISGGLLMGPVLFLLALLNYWYLRSVKSRIAFASAVLSVACQALRDNYAGVITAAYSMLIVQLGWFFLWTVASVGVYQTYNAGSSSTDDTISSGGYGILFALFVSLYWGSEVVKNIIETTVAGTVACWWFQPHRQAVVRGSLLRATTTSFGSICFGSLIVAVIHALREMLGVLRKRQDERDRDILRPRGGPSGDTERLLIWCADQLLMCIEAIAEYINKYAFCYVAAYGYGFLEAAKKVSDLFMQK
jgi:hypothetical protein